MKKQQIVLIVLALLLVFAVGYIIADNLQERRAQELFDAYEAGAQLGYEQAVLGLMQQATNCQPVSLYAGNTTIEVIAVGCLGQRT